MANQSPVVGGVFAGGIGGAILGYVVWMIISPNTLKDNPDPQAQMMSMLFAPIDWCFGFCVVAAGAGIGGTIGGLVSAAGGKPATQKHIPAVPPTSDSTPPEAADIEISRLKQRIAELEDEKAEHELPDE